MPTFHHWSNIWSPVGPFHTVDLEWTIVTLPAGFSYYWEDHHHPVHPLHSETRSFQTPQQGSIQTLSPTTAQTTTTTEGNGSNLPHRPPHTSPALAASFKDPPTPAQQIILNAKARNKDKKTAKGKEKEWPANAQGKLTDPAFVDLHIPTHPSNASGYPPPRPSLSKMTPNLTPSPMCTTDTLSSSPSREAPPLYAQFTSQGTLDVPGTLLMVAKRFEKLKKWTVGHVGERCKEVSASVSGSVASIVTPPTSSIVTHLTGSLSGPSMPIHHRRLSSTTATSPPMTSKKRESGTRLPYHAGDYSSPPDTLSPGNSPPSSISSAMRPLSTAISGLPLHTSSGLGTLPGSSYSTTSLSSLASAQHPHQQKDEEHNNDCLPPKSAAGKRQTSVSPTPRKRYTVALGGSITAPPDEDEFSSNAASLFCTTAANTAANTNANIHTHTDPPATAPLLRRVGTPRWYSRDDDDDKKEEEGAGEFGEGEETIGKSSGIKLKNANGSLSSTTSNSISPGGPGGGDYKSTATTSPSPSTRRIRAQSAYGYASLLPPQTPLQTPTMGTTAPLKPKLRSRSSERLSSGTSSIGTGDGMISGGLGGGGDQVRGPVVVEEAPAKSRGVTGEDANAKTCGEGPDWAVGCVS
ncbi:uncharacterized protein LACBIDRAFT_335261 [Laccaria bicolor S238N-H82]|uniref:Predicted protein n=1 Tax=Laccaria bicolor (strain S238N-H82 / ATCC MYA-4686) TaxID=486041 RepID=B0E1U6_LACBS|nr:uncharacterized protein LACBIDRAFT_335261 [Laccaria bicolor S238N-H82]EDQ99200.1 predicted protein [Laccaria bicolor S238N-H82]|eukprot:XP_001890167.1 predicted protein [Laccaria bicolor S238N-H82]